MRFALNLALKHLLSSKGQSLLIMFAIALGCVVIIWVPSVNDGFYQELLNKTVNTSPHINITRYDDISDITNLSVKDNKWNLNNDKTSLKTRRIQAYKNVMNNIKGIKGITGSTPIVEDNANLINGEKNLNINFVGIEYPQYEDVVNIDKDLVNGTYTKLNPDGIAISQKIAEKLRVQMNDSLYISTPHSTKTLKVVAIYNSGFITKDLTTVYISMNTAQSLSGIGNQVDSIGIKVADPWHVENIAEEATLKTGLEATTWKDDNESLLGEIASFSYIMFLMNSVIMIAIGAGVLGIMIILISSKHKQIGMLKALGVTSGGVIKIFVLEGLILSVFGSIIGSLLGTLSIFLFNEFPMQISETYGISEIQGIYSLSIYAQAIILAIVTGCAASFIPAYLSSKVDPAEVLKST
ncbi:MAG: ABC transporter permease [Vampirovibrionia bacterium]